MAVIEAKILIQVGGGGPYAIGTVEIEPERAMESLADALREAAIAVEETPVDKVE